MTVSLVAAETPASAPRARARLSGWGRYPVAEMEVLRPERLAEIAAAVRSGGSVVARGLGRSYGDAAMNAGGAVILSERLDRLLDFDADSGVVRCESGVTIDDLLRVFVPRGFFPPVVPGTKHVSLGGAVACDIHGKNHHVDGSIARHLLHLVVITAGGESVRCSRDENPDLFWATVGGMGLTGFIAEVALTMKRIAGPGVSVDVDRARDLDEALALFESDARYAYSVAWIDCLASGGALGRSVLMRGNPLAAGETGSAPRKRASEPRTMRVPFDLPGALLNPVTVGVFNAAYFHSHPVQRRAVPTDHDSFFFPLDRVGDWNRLYGRAGFLQFQCAVPFDGGRDVLRRILEELAAARVGSFLAVLKRFGPADPDALLSFPIPGYTLALDLPNRGGVFDVVARLETLVADSGGRVYLAKDARLRPELLAVMYPALERWREVKERYDPNHRFASGLSRRLGLTR